VVLTEGQWVSVPISKVLYVSGTIHYTSNLVLCCCEFDFHSLKIRHHHPRQHKLYILGKERESNNTSTLAKYPPFNCIGFTNELHKRSCCKWANSFITLKDLELVVAVVVVVVEKVHSNFLSLELYVLLLISNTSKLNLMKPL